MTRFKNPSGENMTSKTLVGHFLPTLFLAIFFIAETSCTVEDSNAGGGYEDLLALFADWREFEQPPSRDGAPDYTAERLEAGHRELKDYQSRLYAIESEGWPIGQQVDWHLLRAEMNGFDFNLRVLKSWARDPAFYQSVCDPCGVIGLSTVSHDLPGTVGYIRVTYQQN